MTTEAEISDVCTTQGMPWTIDNIRSWEKDLEQILP